VEIAKSGKGKKSSPVKVGMQKHDIHLKRLARIKGQLEGIERMMNESRYCTEILQQIKSVSSALKGLESSVLDGHIRGCVKKAFSSKDPFEIEEKIDEMMVLFRAT
jgi:DNA-binding FrmR family transcriptional regulator